jgi:sigma-B regulation protein RsbU (phosphoserine phosphatase)
MSNRVFHLRVPAEASCLHAVRAFVASALAATFGEQTVNVVLALDEACANVIKHRAPLPGRDDIELRIELDEAAVRFRIGCFCAERDVPRIKPRDLADLRPGGLGTHLIGQIMDRIDYEPDPTAPGRMVLVLEKRCQAGGRR